MLYFAYGSNMRAQRIEARLGACEGLGNAYLKGYRLTFSKRGGDGTGKCNIELTGDHRRLVHGGLYRLNPGQAGRLDEFEGKGYIRRTVNLWHRRKKISAFAYVARSDWIAPQLCPYDWYHALVVRGAIDLGLSRGYVQRLRAVPSIIDTDQERRLVNFRLVMES